MNDGNGKCPKCGSADGFYTRYMVGYMSFYRFGGSEPFDSEQSGTGRGGTVAYCMACDRPIGPASELIAASKAQAGPR